VLAVENGKALIITDKIIDFRAYHNEWEDITWAECDLRAYLNGEFYNGFSATDKAKIAETRNVNKDNQWHYPEYDPGDILAPRGGADTTDKIFLLSLEEVVKYFGDSGQLAKGNSYVWNIDDQYNGARIAYTAKEYVFPWGYAYPAGTAWRWWLRSPGDISEKAVEVDGGGYIVVFGNPVGDSVSGLRPALWLNP
jgi:hypothetical protein